MTTLAHPDKILRYRDSDKKIHISQDFLVSRVYDFTGAGTYGTTVRFNSTHEPVWFRQLFRPTPDAGADIQGRECELSPDGQFLYVVGETLASPANNEPNFYKLNAATGATVWARETSVRHSSLAVDHAGNIIIWGETLDLTPVSTLKKYDSSGGLIWSKLFADVTAIAVDSQNNIYITHSPQVGGYNLRKLNTSGIHQWGVDLNDELAALQHAKDVAVNKDDDIFVVGSPAEVSPGVWHKLYKFNTSGTPIDSAPTGLDSYSTAAECVVCDSLGNVIAADPRYVQKYTAALTGGWYNWDSLGDSVLLATDVQNRVHVFHAKNGGPDSGHLIRDKDGNQDFYDDTKNFDIKGVVMAREVYISHYTDQTTKLHHEDVSTFQDNTIPEWTDPAIPGDWMIGDKCYRDQYILTTYFEHRTGIFESLVDDNVRPPGEYEDLWKQLSRVPPCANANWNAYSGIGIPGGIGGAPSVYTITFTGMSNRGDNNGTSPYNGEYLMIRGPGLMGFFFGYSRTTGLRINYQVDKDLAGISKESIIFGSAALPSSIFNYEANSSYDEKLTNIPNANTDAGSAIAHGGTASMYPENHPKWDAITVWPADRIVAWKGRFYKALNQNVNSPPPGADWVVL